MKDGAQHIVPEHNPDGSVPSKGPEQTGGKLITRRYFIASMISLGIGTATTAFLLSVTASPQPDEEPPEEIVQTPDGEIIEPAANKYLAYVCTGDLVSSKIADPDLVISCLDRESMLLLGSSELARDHPDTIPTKLFYNKGYDADFCLVGNAGCQSLWAAMEVAAMAPNLLTKKVVLIVSQLWATTGLKESAFQKWYSPKAMKLMIDDSELSDQTKSDIMTRAAAMLEGSSYENQAKQDTPLDFTNSYVNCLADSVRIDAESAALTFPEVEYTPVCQSVDDIDWNALLTQAKAEGAAACTNNSYGIRDAEYTGAYANVEANSQSNTHWEVSSEYGDLELFLRVCQECGIQPLLIMQPVMGAWSDYVGVSKTTRQAFYDHIRSLATQYEASVADFSAYEYETYFMSDPLHLGWEGWLYVEKSIIEFYRDNQSNQG